MTELVNPSEIEMLVGAERHVTDHIARWDSQSGQVYILHSHHCLESKIDLRDCEYSLALDRGIWMESWQADHHADNPIVVKVREGELVPK